VDATDITDYRRTIIRRWILGLLATCLPVAAICADPAAATAPDDSNPSPPVALSGFGTLGAVHSSSSLADYTSNLFKPNGAGHSHDWSFDVDSLVAGQMLMNFTPQWSAMVQATVEQQYDNSYVPTLEWANVKYEFTPDLDVRLGRVLLPSFLVSDDRKVGYANPWVRPPIEVYWLVPVTKNDGIDSSYRAHWGDVSSTFLATYGELATNGVGSVPGRARQQEGIFNTTEYGPFTFHVTYQQTHFQTAALTSLFNAFRSFGPQGEAIAGRWQCDGKEIKLRSVGLEVDPGDWFTMAEWARNDAHCFIGAQAGWYVTGGYRVSDWTPYLTYADLKVKSNTSDPGLDLALVAPYLAGEAAGLNAALNGVLGSTGAQRTVSIGLRWDVRRDIDVKAQFDQIYLAGGSPGLLVNVQPGFAAGSSLHVISVTMDFVF
jgi:hypothetical protein